LDNREECERLCAPVANRVGNADAPLVMIPTTTTGDGVMPGIQVERSRQVA